MSVEVGGVRYMTSVKPQDQTASAATAYNVTFGTEDITQALPVPVALAEKVVEQLSKSNPSWSIEAVALHLGGI
jgi:hypothetical protein